MHTGSRLPSLSFLFFFFTLSVFQVSPFSTPLPCFFQLLTFSSSRCCFHISLVRICPRLTDYTHSHTTRRCFHTIPPLVLFQYHTLSASISNLILSIVWICTQTHTHTMNQSHTKQKKLNISSCTILCFGYISLQYCWTASPCNTKEWEFCIRVELAEESEREESESESCLHLNCSALRLFNLIMRLHFIEPGCRVPLRMKDSLWSAG